LRLVDAGDADQIIVLGTAQDERQARQCGLEPRGHLSRRWLSALRGLRRLCSGARLIYAWSARSAVLASLAVPQRRLIVTLTLPPQEHFRRAGFRSSMTRRLLGREEIRCTSQVVRDSCAAIGLSAELIDVSCSGVGDTASREVLRQRWNVQDEFVVGLGVEPYRSADIRAATALTARVGTTDCHVKLIAHPAGVGRSEAIRGLGSLDRMHELVFDDLVARPWNVLPGLDAMLHVGATAQVSALPLRWALAANVPVLADEGAEVREVVGRSNGAGARIVNFKDVNAASQALLELIETVRS
jgi:hypothetical protein